MAAEGERPKRDFKSGDRPFGKGPRPEGKPYEKREGPRKPYAPVAIGRWRRMASGPSATSRAATAVQQGATPEGSLSKSSEGPPSPMRRWRPPMAAEALRRKSVSTGPSVILRSPEARLLRPSKRDFAIARSAISTTARSATFAATAARRLQAASASREAAEEAGERIAKRLARAGLARAATPRTDPPAASRSRPGSDLGGLQRHAERASI